ncbi:HDIG domain-containing metalloprotein [Spirillospora sp. NPDC048911]|uniref:HDIG domain-containing metalloprotein n=1 Tax=Spirillospora sp. NPDC048911 TaxID=3364527 RepID=UPI003721A9B1
MQIPSDREIRALHEEYAPSAAAFELVYTHCQIVCEVAEQLLSRHDVDLDAELVRAGCLLHDIGVYALYGPSGELDHSRYIRHGVLGHALLRGLGFPEVLCRFCSCHTGVGLSRDDVTTHNLSIPVGDYLAETGEEELVMFADKFHSKTDPPVFVSAASFAVSVARYGADKPARFAALLDRFGEPDLGPLQAAYGGALV